MCSSFRSAISKLAFITIIVVLSLVNSRKSYAEVVGGSVLSGANSIHVSSSSWQRKFLQRPGHMISSAPKPRTSVFQRLKCNL